MDDIVLITGANRGLGLATARRLAEAGATVLLGSRDGARGEAAAAQLRTEGLQVQAVELDVTSDESVAAAAALVADAHGRLDVLINNAGILPEATAPDAADTIDVDLVQQTFETNVFGAARMIQHLTPLLRRAEAGRIVNVSSTMGSLADQSDPGSPYYGVVVPGYQASKAALNSITVAVAKRLAGTGITVTSVCPGWVQTDLGGAENRANAPLSADEAAAIVAAVATAAPTGPSGQFVDAAGAVRW